jgi:RimJ/RimL family protein N-acetyltransferase
MLAAGDIARTIVPDMALALRPLDDADLDRLFEWERAPQAVAMAAFTRADPSDRAAFDRHYERIRPDPDCVIMAIDDAGAFVGTIGSFTMEDEREVTYWIDPSRWGCGIATRALQAFLRVEVTRPLFARVAEHNIGSAKVLARAGFVQIGSDTSYADGAGRRVVEHIYCLAT